MTISSIKDIVAAELDGKTMTYNFRKVTNQITTSSVWFDMSIGTGNPWPKYWFDAEPLKAKIASQSQDWWFYHWKNISPLKKYLRKTTNTIVGTWVPFQQILCDYLLYYPSVAQDTTDTQIMDNTVTLSRYTDGKWVQILPILVAGAAWGGTFSVTYTNSEWLSWRQSSTAQVYNNAVGSVVHSQWNTDLSAWPFLWLQSGDTWVRSIDSITMATTDIWLMSFILVKPLAYSQIINNTAPTEIDYFLDLWTLPQIEDDAYLSYLACPRWTLSGIQQYMEMTIIWE